MKKVGRFRVWESCLGAAVLVIACSPLPGQARESESADMVLLHGNVIPMTGPNVRAEALAVKDGKILAVGADSEIERLQGANTRRVDLRGRTVLPGFIDAHGHITGVAQQLSQVALQPPPVGEVKDIAAFQAKLREAARNNPNGWVVGAGYDDAQLEERRHPTRQELDAVATDRPVLVVHVSGHIAVMNTHGLELMGMLHDAKDPEGGMIRREADGKTASGVLEERAMALVLGRLPKPSLDQQIAGLSKAQRLYAQNGLTTAQDGATMPDAWRLLSEAARRKSIFIDIHALPFFMAKWDNIAGIPFNRPYQNHLRAAGVKIVLDGSPQGRTAWLSHPFHVPPEGRPETYSGYRQISDERFRDALQTAAGHGWQAYVHVNGDAAIQQLIDGVRAVGETIGKPVSRTIAIHAQTVRLDQLKAMKTLDIEPSFFAAHTYYWGDWHRDVTLGPSRADRISPQRDAFDVGLRPTIHNDSPIVPPNMFRLIWSAVTRRTRSDDILGPAERVSAYEALAEVTSNAAYQIHEENIKGVLSPGKMADFVILDKDPLSISSDMLLNIRVESTVKQGNVVFGSM